MDAAVARIVRNTLSSFAFRVVNLGLGFLMIPFLLRELGQAGYGLIALVGVITGYFQLLGAQVPQGSVKFIAEYEARGDREGVHRVINTTTAFFGVIGMVVSLLISVAVLFGATSLLQISEEELPTATAMLWVAAGMALISWPSTSLINALQGLQEYHRLNLITSVSWTFGQLLGLAAALSGFGALGVFVAFQVGDLVKWSWLAVTLRRLLPEWRPTLMRFDASTLRLIMGISLWMLLQEVSQMLSWQTDYLIIGAALPVAMIAAYDVTLRPFNLIRGLNGMFNSALMPAISAAYAQQGRKGIEQFIYTGSRYNNLFTAPLCIVGVLLMRPFLRLWVGEDFLEFVWVAQLTMVFGFIWWSTAMLGQVYWGTGNVRTPALVSISQGVANVVLSIWWVQLIGVEGVILATVFTFALGVPLKYWLIFPELQIDRWKYFTNTLLRVQLPYACLTLPALWFWHDMQEIDRWWVLILVGAGLMAPFYAVGWFWGVEPEHRRWIVASVRRRIAPKTGARPAPPNSTVG